MHHYKIQNELIFFTELFYGCKANCSGCNVNKTLDELVTYSMSEIKIINDRVLEYRDFLSKKDNKDYQTSITLGPADFVSLDVDYIISVLEIFDNSIKLIISGNLLNKDYSNTIERIKTYSKENNKQVIFQIVFNPLLTHQNEMFLRNNMKKITSGFGKFDIVLNMSKALYEKYQPQQFLDMLLSYEISSMALVSSPNTRLLEKKMFQVSLVEETEWLKELLVLITTVQKYNDVVLEVFENREKFFKNYDIKNNDFTYIYEVVFGHHKKILYIDKKMELRLSCENIGDYHYIEENNFDSLGSLKDNSIEALVYHNPKFEKILQKQITGITNKCGVCPFKTYCMTTPVHWQKIQYPITKGVEDEKYCYGLKEINQYIASLLKI